MRKNYAKYGKSITLTSPGKTFNRNASNHKEFAENAQFFMMHYANTGLMDDNWSHGISPEGREYVLREVANSEDQNNTILRGLAIQIFIAYPHQDAIMLPCRSMKEGVAFEVLQFVNPRIAVSQ